MTTDELVKALMDAMASHNYSLGQARVHLTREFNDNIEMATRLIQDAFERDGSLTPNTKV